MLTGANRTDMKLLPEVLDAAVLARPLVRDETGAWAPLPCHLCLDRGYAYDECRAAAETRGYTVHLPPPSAQPRAAPPPGDPARHPARRWVVERTHAWFNRFRRLLVRWEKQAATHLGFLHLAAGLIIYRKLRHARSLSG